MSALLYSHNIDQHIIADKNYQALYTQKRRDSNFAAAIRHGNSVHAFRDHLGIAPLYYRFTDEGTGIKFSNQLTDLVQSSDKLNVDGVRACIQLRTPRLLSLFDEIHIVPPATVININVVSREVKPVYSYCLCPQHIPINTSLDDLADQFKRLMIGSISRCLQHDTVGLYLSGGIDSALIGLFLKELGVEVHAYTSGPWGKTSEDVKYAIRNAQRIDIKHHEIHYLETTDYHAAMSEIVKQYGIPQSNSAGLGVIKLWENTSIGDQKQLFFGQNCDTMFGAMTALHRSYFLHLIPGFVAKHIHPALRHSAVVQNYVHLACNFQRSLRQLVVPETPANFSKLQKLIMAGMYIVQTPHDSETFTQLPFIRGQNITSPYHNIDLVEFAMGLPFLMRIAFGRRGELVLEKLVSQRLASRYFRRDVVSRKKAFIVSFDRDHRTRSMYNAFPNRLFNLSLDKSHERYGADILIRWLTRIGVPLSQNVTYSH